MTQPRRLLAGQTHSITRRVARRCFLLKPTSFVNSVVLYSLGYAKSRHPEFRLHAFVAEANHHHTNCTDAREEEQGEASPLPGFFHSFHRMVASSLNTHYGRGENFWRDGSYDNVEIHSPVSLEQQLIYLWTNPVRDGLVERPEDWPGVIFLPEDFGKTFRAERPAGAFFGGRTPGQNTASGRGADVETVPASWQAELAAEEAEAWALLKGKRKPLRPRRNRSTLPRVVEFTIDPPPGYEDMTLEELRRHFRELLDAEIERIHSARRAAGRLRFRGRKAVLNQDPRESAGETWPTFALNPRIACRGDTRKRLAVLQGLVEWRLSYRVAYEALLRGTGVAFPAGSYGLARFPRVRVRRWATGPPVRAA